MNCYPTGLNIIMAENRLLQLIVQNSEAILNINTKRSIWTWSFLLVLLSSFGLLLCWILQPDPHVLTFGKPCVIFAILSWVNWWAWTMVLLFLLLSNQKIEVDLMVEISNDVKNIRKDVHTLYEHSLDIHSYLED